jgi:hypothetical protein
LGNYRISSGNDIGEGIDPVASGNSGADRVAVQFGRGDCGAPDWRFVRIPDDPAIVPNVVCAFEAVAESSSAANIKDVRFVIVDLVVEKFDSSWSQMQFEQSQRNI